MSLPPPRLFDPKKDQALFPQLAQIHADCIVHDGQMLTFLPPLDQPKLINYWAKLSEKHERDEIAIVLQLADGKNESGEEVVAGVVYLAMSSSETGPFRGEVNKLMVSLNFRRMGVARRLMEKLEEVAREKKSFLLVLDTAIGTAAEGVYPKLGYKEIGVIPKYGFSPKDGSYLDERFYYKDLRDT